MSEEKEENKASFGWIPDKKDKRDFKWRMVKDFMTIPTKVELLDNCGKIRNQGNEGACVGFAGAALKDWYEKSQENLVEGGLSSRCIYNGARSLEGRLGAEGAYLRDALKWLQKLGVCREHDWPYYAWQPSWKSEPREVVSIEQMKPYKIKSYVRLSTINEVLEALAEGLPVYAGVLWYSNWIYVGKDGKLPEKNYDVVGGHAIFLVGYDLEEKWILFQNSWGNYGMNGFGKMPLKSMQLDERQSDFWTIVDIEPGDIEPDPEPKPSWLEQLIEWIKDLFNR